MLFKKTAYMTPTQYQCKMLKGMMSSAKCNNPKTVYKSFCNNLETFYNNSCVDPCKNIKCGINEVCQKGICIPTCHPSGYECVSSGECCSKNCDFGSCN